MQNNRTPKLRRLVAAALLTATVSTGVVVGAPTPASAKTWPEYNECVTKILARLRAAGKIEGVKEAVEKACGPQPSLPVPSKP